MWQVSFCYICCRCCRITFANKPGRQKKLWLSNVGSTTEEELMPGAPMRLVSTLRLSELADGRPSLEISMRSSTIRLPVALSSFRRCINGSGPERVGDYRHFSCRGSCCGAGHLWDCPSFQTNPRKARLISAALWSSGGEGHVSGWRKV